MGIFGDWIRNVIELEMVVMFLEVRIFWSEGEGCEEEYDVVCFEED